MKKRSADEIPELQTHAAEAAPEKRTRMEPFKMIMPSKLAQRMVHRNRDFIKSLKSGMKPKASAKKMIVLAKGDPTVFGNLPPPSVLTDKIVQHAKSGQFYGYANSAGHADAQLAVAKKYSNKYCTLSAEDVIIASGGSGALEIIISGIADKGHNILLPRPGFCYYESVAKAREIGIRYYNLLPRQDWAIDLPQLESLIDANTRAIVINNPCNPCGSVFTKDHLLDLLRLAEKHRIPIISDEIYASLTFPGFPMFSVGDLSERVPVIVVGGLAKDFAVPGLRVGWAVLHDRGGVLAQLREGFIKLSRLVLGANTLVQSVMPTLLNPTPGSDEAVALEKFHKNYVGTLERHAELTVNMLGRVPQLEVQKPRGAMYAMVRIKVEMFKDIPDDDAFCRLLLHEESVFVLAGKCFGLPNFFRLVFAAPPDKLKEAYTRLELFCNRHAIQKNID